MWFALFVVALLASPVVLVALLANRAQRRSLEALRPDDAVARPAVAVAATAPRTWPMLRTTSPVRLSLLRALLAALVVAFPAVFLATGSQGVLAGHVGWCLFAGYPGAAVLLASWVERRAVRRDDGASARVALLLAGLAATVIVVVGGWQGVYAAHVHEGGAASALEWLHGVLGEAIAAPVTWSVTGVAVFALAGAGWGLPVAAATRERIGPQVPGWKLGIVAVLGVTVPAYVYLTLVYEGAGAIDAWIGGEAPAAAQ